ncbi:hypothetical protein JCM8208_004665 [Rhodotorula glutinis]
MSSSSRPLTGAPKHAHKSSDHDLIASLLPTTSTSASSAATAPGRPASSAAAPALRPRHAAHRVARAVAASTWTTRLVLLTLVFLVVRVLPFPVPPFTAPLSLPHPIPHLIAAAERTHAERLAAAPRTLADAASRYSAHPSSAGRRPPKGYDAWFNFASQRSACRIDGFDELRRSLGVWWGVEGREIRARMDRMGDAGDAASALGRVRVRGGRVVGWDEMRREGLGVGARDMEGKDARRALEDMLQALMDEGVRLPDVDLFVNQLDEPRVVMPYEVRTELEARGRRRKPRPYQLDDFVLHEASAPGARPAYDVIRQTCPPSSLARRTALSPSPGTNPHVSQRHTSRFTTPPSLGSFLAHPDLERTTWCDQPDLQELHQTFIRPLSFSWTDGVWPVFSNSKLDGFGDMLVPAWYTWYDRMPYDEDKDVAWKGKANHLYWRGTNTGGRSVGLEWMGWMRSRLVSKVNRLIEWRHEDRVLVATADNHTLSATLPSSALNAALADVAFAAPDHHGDADSIESQRTEPSFRFTDGGHYVPFEHNYLFKAVLDLDGTAYSGRFPTLMRSRSAVVKSRLFTEALDDTLIPWYHYVPLSVRYTELYHVLAYFFGLAAVPAVARDQGLGPLAPHDLDTVRRGVAHEEALYTVAERGRTWATECARRDDALAYVYLLVLEWARLCADDREGDAWNLVL